MKYRKKIRWKKGINENEKVKKKKAEKKKRKQE